MSIRPPFRADQVGSLLRSRSLKGSARQARQGAISAAELTAIEDVEIKKIIAKQEAIGLEGITDGEFAARGGTTTSFGNPTASKRFRVDQGIQFAGVQTKAEAPHVMSKIGFSGHPFVDHFKFLKANTKKTAKQTIPSPSMLHYRGGRKLINMGVYPDLNDFYNDLGAAYGKAVRAFGDAGCTYLQLDDVSFAYLCDPEQRKMLKDRGDDPEKQPMIYAGMINKALDQAGRDDRFDASVPRQFPFDLRSVRRLQPIADLLFNQVNVDGYFMEWDSDRAGGFEPLRFLPKAGGRARSRHVEDRRAGKRRMTSSGASTRPRNTRRSNNSACPRNAASLPLRKATRWPRTSSGASLR